MFAAIGRFSYRFRWWVLAVWAATFVVALVASTHVAGELKGGGFSNPQAPAQQALRLMQQRLDTGLSQLVVVFTSDTLHGAQRRLPAARSRSVGRPEAADGAGPDAGADLRRHRRLPVRLQRRQGVAGGARVQGAHGDGAGGDPRHPRRRAADAAQDLRERRCRRVRRHGTRLGQRLAQGGGVHAARGRAGAAPGVRDAGGRRVARRRRRHGRDRHAGRALPLRATSSTSPSSPSTRRPCWAWRWASTTPSSWWGASARSCARGRRWPTRSRPPSPAPAAPSSSAASP